MKYQGVVEVAPGLGEGAAPGDVIVWGGIEPGQTGGEQAAEGFPLGGIDAPEELCVARHAWDHLKSFPSAASDLCSDGRRDGRMTLPGDTLPRVGSVRLYVNWP